jgi:uncharacterized membrane protein
MNLPSFGPYHPIVVHFAIGFLVAGVMLRVISLTGRVAFAGPAALGLILTGVLASKLAVESGLAAHGPVERIPGVAEEVVRHEEWGKRTLAVFLGVGGLEVLAFILRRWGKERYALLASGALGLGGLFCLFEAGSHGGELVYSFAGGVGTRSGDSADVGRLLLAGLYNQILADRQAGRSQDAIRLAEEAARRFPGDAGVQMMAAESKLRDGHDPAGAMDALGRLNIPSSNRRLRLQHGFLLADALEAAGQKEGARAALQSLRAEFPDSGQLKRRLEAAPAPSPAGPSSAPSPSLSAR